MKINDIVLNEDNSLGSTNDYQKMMNFVRASGISGLPQDQQVALALFRELERQKSRNDQLDKELDAAEQRIDVATQSGEMQKQALGKNQAELEKERSNIAQQQAAVGKLDKTYAEREQASKEQLRDLTDKLEVVKSKPGVDPEVTKKLEKEISNLKQNGVGADKVKELEQSIASIQQMSRVDDATMNDLIAKVNDAQKAAQELKQTKQTVGQDAEETAQRALDQVEQIKKQLAQFREVEAETTLLAQQVNKLAQRQKADDELRAASLAPATSNLAKDQIAKQAAGALLTPASATPNPQMSLPGVETPAPTTGSQIALPGLDQPETEPDRAKNLVKQIKQASPAEVYESQLQNAIKWATGKTK